MKIDLAGLIDAATACIAEHADTLTELDQAIGDGDHGSNMKRGFDAVAEIRSELVGLAPGQALQKLGMTLVMKVGGAAGPLYGSLFMSMGKALPDQPTLGELASALNAGINAVKQRGKSTVGEKTMLDVLVPVNEVIDQASTAQAGAAELLDRIGETAAASVEATIPMLATKGRAAFLGERSIGHQDPGATSSRLLIDAICASVRKAL